MFKKLTREINNIPGKKYQFLSVKIYIDTLENFKTIPEHRSLPVIFFEKLPVKSS